MSTQIKTQDIAAAAITASKLAIPTTKGDLLGYDTAPNRVPVGTDGQMLVADSTQNLGVKWATAPVGLMSSNFVENEVPGGTINGTNAAFTLANTPVTGSVKFFKNGLRQSPTVDFTVSGTTVTFVAGNLPQSGDVLLVDYRK